MLVVGLEGIDGSGKSTLGWWLYGRLRGMGWRVDLLSEPWELPPDGFSGWDAEAQARWYWEDRRRLYRDCEYRVEGLDVLLLDRTYHSTLAYQGAGMGMGVELAFEVGGIGGGYFEPDLLVVLDVPLGIAWGRCVRRGELFDWRFMARVRDYYRSLSARESVLRVVYPVDRVMVLDWLLSRLVGDSGAFTNSASIPISDSFGASSQ